MVEQCIEVAEQANMHEGHYNERGEKETWGLNLGTRDLLFCSPCYHHGATASGIIARTIIANHDLTVVFMCRRAV